MAESIVVSVALGLAMFLLGAMTLRAILLKPGKLEILSFSFPLGGGILTWVIFISSLFGVPIKSIPVIVIYGVILTLLLVIVRVQSPEAGRIRPEYEDTQDGINQRYIHFLWITLTVIFGIALVYAIARSYSSYDAASGWAVKGYGIVEEGTVLAASRWGMWGSAYPLNLSMQIGLFKLFSGDLLPTSKAIYPVFAVTFYLGCYRFWRMNRVPDLLAFLGVLFLATNPLFFLHSTVGYANLPFTFYIVTAALLTIEGFSKDDGRVLLLSGVFYGLAAWTRAEGIGYCLLVILGILIAQWISGNRRLRLIPVLAPLVIIGGSWLIFGRSGIEESHLGNAMGGVVPEIMEGQFNLYELYIIPVLFIRRALSLDNWGYFIPVTLLLVLLGIQRLHFKRYPIVFSVLVTTVIMILMPIGLFYVRSFTIVNFDEFIHLLTRSFDRAMIPGASMSIILAILMFGREQLLPEWLVDRARSFSANHTFRSKESPNNRQLYAQPTDHVEE